MADKNKCKQQMYTKAATDRKYFATVNWHKGFAQNYKKSWCVYTKSWLRKVNFWKLVELLKFVDDSFWKNYCMYYINNLLLELVCIKIYAFIWKTEYL